MFSFSTKSAPSPSRNDAWLSTPEEGQLSVDVFRDGKDLVIRSTLAGVTPEQLDIAIHDDLLTIRGERKAEQEINDEDWFYRECYWGTFSRSIILPMDVYAEQTQASVKNGLLEIRIPIRQGTDGMRISVRND